MKQSHVMSSVVYFSGKYAEYCLWGAKWLTGNLKIFENFMTNYGIPLWILAKLGTVAIELTNQTLYN